MFKIILIAGVFFLCSCSHKNDFAPVFSIPVEFQPYVDSFVAAASERGHNMVVNNLIITYDSSISNVYCAYSNVISSRNDVQKIIYINPYIHCWQNHTQLETLIFMRWVIAFLEEIMTQSGCLKVIRKVSCILVIFLCIHPAFTK